MMDERDQAMQELAELYALGGLEPEERAAVEAQLKSAACQDALKRGQLAAYAVAVSASQAPPPQLRDRVLAIARPQASGPTPIRRPAWWQQPAWLATAAAIVIVIFAATYVRQTWFAPHWAVTCTQTSTACAVSGRVVASSKTTLRFEARGMQALPAGKVYQAWYIRPGAKPTPAPTFVPDANGNGSVTLPVGPEKGLTVAITVEPEGGSQAPTTKPFLVATIQ
ncbi:MAG: anti-sigma factor [Candidatus Eremiobacteraeota bacterium]|nr:anti-sigma factor [Candidatus Eremiobacteraeota bacterium]MBV8222211.1 anti-sigma factor [Candidatus Eremiobacteraeota bacterium]MBV8281658.1 anti-sigma factor [Candidatus Eremiobacteraeota bacterium]